MVKGFENVLDFSEKLFSRLANDRWSKDEAVDLLRLVIVTLDDAEEIVGVFDDSVVEGAQSFFPP